MKIKTAQTKEDFLKCLEVRRKLYTDLYRRKRQRRLGLWISVPHHTF